VTLGRACMVHPEHEQDVPIEGHHVRPLARGGGDAQVISLCANAHGRVHVLLDEIEAVATATPFGTVSEVLRTIPNDLWPGFDVTERMIAFHGWESYGLSFLNGRYLTAHRLWRTDGSPKEPDVPLFADLGHAARWSKKWRRELDAL
jgi:hypothetical protein